MSHSGVSVRAMSQKWSKCDNDDMPRTQQRSMEPEI